jgi:hypothetical protein
MVTNIRHCGIVVSDITLAEHLFVEYLGFIKTFHADDLSGPYYDRLLDLRNACLDVIVLKCDDNSRIELLQYKSGPTIEQRPIVSHSPGVSHVALTVNDITALYDARNNYPVRFLSPPTLNPEGTARVAYVILMEECLVELVEVLSPEAAFTGGN